MGNISKFWVMIPVGFEETHREAFLKNILKINPNNDISILTSKWEMLSKMGVLQIVIDVRSGATVCSMLSGQMGTTWQISKEILKSIKNINNYEAPSEEDMEYDDSDYMSNDKKINHESNNATTNESKYDVDDLLDIISTKGYEALNIEQKQFLNSLKK